MMPVLVRQPSRHHWMLERHWFEFRYIEEDRRLWYMGSQLSLMIQGHYRLRTLPHRTRRKTCIRDMAMSKGSRYHIYTIPRWSTAWIQTCAISNLHDQVKREGRNRSTLLEDRMILLEWCPVDSESAYSVCQSSHKRNPYVKSVLFKTIPYYALTRERRG